MSSPEPTEYRAPRWIVAALGVVLFPVGTGLVKALTATEPKPTQRLLWALFALVVVGWIVDTLTSRVTIDQGAVRLHSLLGTRAVRLDRIDYVRHESPGVQLRMKSGEWERLTLAWLRASPSTRQRVAAGIEAAMRGG